MCLLCVFFFSQFSISISTCGTKIWGNHPALIVLFYICIPKISTLYVCFKLFCSRTLETLMYFLLPVHVKLLTGKCLHVEWLETNGENYNCKSAAWVQSSVSFMQSRGSAQESTSHVFYVVAKLQKLYHSKSFASALNTLLYVSLPETWVSVFVAIVQAETSDLLRWQTN